jgi:hypothetical protein
VENNHSRTISTAMVVSDHKTTNILKESKRYRATCKEHRLPHITNTGMWEILTIFTSQWSASDLDRLYLLCRKTGLKREDFPLSSYFQIGLGISS